MSRATTGRRSSTTAARSPTSRSAAGLEAAIPPPPWPVPAEIEPRRRSSHCAALRVWRPCVSIAFERDLQVIAAEAPLNPSTTAARHPGITLPEKAQRTLIVAALPSAPAKPPAATLIRAVLPALIVRWVFAEVTCAVFLPTAVLMR